MALQVSSLKIGLGGLGAVVAGGALAQILAPAAVAPVSVGVGVALILTAAHHWKTDQWSRLSAEVEHGKAALQTLKDELEETRALVGLQEPRFQLPLPWSAWALPPRAILEIERTIQLANAKVLVECGSGLSTLHLARVMSVLGRGHVYALEQDEAWAAFVERLLAQNDLAAHATVVRAPLAEATFCGRATTWYAVPAGAIPADARIDVLIVDGPTGKDGVLARLGALPFFWDGLREKATIFLDDTRRPEEQEICKIWRETYPLDETSLGAEHGMSKFIRRPV